MSIFSSDASSCSRPPPSQSSCCCCSPSPLQGSLMEQAIDFAIPDQGHISYVCVCACVRVCVCERERVCV